jgi:outer membrane protein OmpA-like peptidoglycan-associated protein
MRINKQTAFLLLMLVSVILLTGATNTLAQDTGAGPDVRMVANGQRIEKFKGVVVKRNADSFNMRDPTGSGPDTVVLLTPSTEVKSHKKGLLRGSKEYAVTNILRGLRLEVDGTGNAEGQLVADKIRFDEQDLRAAQALQVTDQLAQENERRVAAAEENARKLAGQIEENTALANAAQARADEAMKNAERANNRINGLDDYDPVRTFTVLFRPGSAVLSPKAKADMDAGAAWVKTQNTKGWVVAVVGFADTTGNTARNRSLSERRANAVIGYLVMKHNLPLQRLIQPFGYGDSNAVADNTTADGRAKNRRVEIRLLVNKGIAGTVD